MLNYRGAKKVTQGVFRGRLCNRAIASLKHFGDYKPDSKIFQQKQLKPKLRV